MQTLVHACCPAAPKYLPPNTEVIEIAVERGFANSTDVPAPEWKDENW